MFSELTNNKKDFYLAIQYQDQVYIQTKLKVDNRDLYIFPKGQFGTLIQKKIEYPSGKSIKLDLKDLEHTANTENIYKVPIKLSLHESGCIHIKDHKNNYKSKSQFPYHSLPGINEFFIFCLKDPLEFPANKRQLKKVTHLVIPTDSQFNPEIHSILFKIGIAPKNISENDFKEYENLNRYRMILDAELFYLFVALEFKSDFQQKGLHLLFIPENV